MTRQPFNDVYDLYRTARLNVKYYTEELSNIQKWNKRIEIVLAITAPGSGLAVSDLYFLKFGIGEYFWHFLLLITSFLAIVQPIIKLKEKIGNLTELVTGYDDLEMDLYRIIISINERQTYDQELKSRFGFAIEKLGKLRQRSPKRKADESLLGKCTEEVKVELPASMFYIPGGP